MIDKSIGTDARERTLRRLYIDLVAHAVAGFIDRDPGAIPGAEVRPFDPGLRVEGRDWPTKALTMIGLERLRNVVQCAENVLDGGIPGDFVETGVWRGGATILMRAILRAYDVTDRRVWVVDSFEGLPQPDSERYPADERSTLHLLENLRVSLDEVRANFAAFDLLDDNVQFVKGWFRDTIPAFAGTKLAILRLDGDMYESTWLALSHLYPKLSPGGYCIIDDFGAVPECAQAVADYRAKNNIGTPLSRIDWTGVFWRKP